MQDMLSRKPLSPRFPVDTAPGPAPSPYPLPPMPTCISMWPRLSSTFLLPPTPRYPFPSPLSHGHSTWPSPFSPTPFFRPPPHLHQHVAQRPRLVIHKDGRHAEVTKDDTHSSVGQEQRMAPVLTLRESQTHARGQPMHCRRCSLAQLVRKKAAIQLKLTPTPPQPRNRVWRQFSRCGVRQSRHISCFWPTLQDLRCIA